MVGWRLLLVTVLTLCALHFTLYADGSCDDRLCATNPGAFRAVPWVDGTARALRSSRALTKLSWHVFLHAPVGAASEWGPIRVGMWLRVRGCMSVSGGWTPHAGCLHLMHSLVKKNPYFLTCWAGIRIPYQYPYSVFLVH